MLVLDKPMCFFICQLFLIPTKGQASWVLHPGIEDQNLFSLSCSVVLSSTDGAEIPPGGQRSFYQNAKLSSVLPAEGKRPMQEDALRIRAHFPSFFLWCPPWVVVEVFGDHMAHGAASKSSKYLQGL